MIKTGTMVGLTRGVVAAVCSLLAVATPSSAQSAWTMWMMGASSPWDSVGTFAAREQCMEALHQQALAVQKLGLKVSEDGAAGSFAGSDTERDIRGQCLPDSVDPRVAKEK